MNIQLMLSLFGGLLSFLHIKHTELRPKKLDDAEQKKSTFFSFSSTTPFQIDLRATSLLFLRESTSCDVHICLIQGRSSNPYPFMVDSILIAMLTAYGHEAC